MPLASIQHYLKRLPERKAEWTLALIEAASWPHLKDEARRKASAQLEKVFGVKTRRATPAELKLIGIEVELHKAEPADIAPDKKPS